MKKLEKISQATNLDDLPEKFNAVVDRLNEICDRLFPSAREPNENKGYENQPISEPLVTDPNDR